MNEFKASVEDAVDSILFLWRVTKASSIRTFTSQLRRLLSCSNRGTLYAADNERLCTAFSTSL